MWWFPLHDTKRWSLVAVTAGDLASANQTCLFRVSVTGEQSKGEETGSSLLTRVQCVEGRGCRLTAGVVVSRGCVIEFLAQTGSRLGGRGRSFQCWVEPLRVLSSIRPALQHVFWILLLEAALSLLFHPSFSRAKFLFLAFQYDFSDLLSS